MTRLRFLAHAILVGEIACLALAHSLQNDELPPLRVFGGKAAMRSLRLGLDLAENNVEKRSWADPDVNHHKKCGPSIGVCDPGDCCSAGGNCGKGYHYCSSPNCQMAYSDGCDANIRPLGESTLDVPRPLIGNVTYDGGGIDHCRTPGAIALTFDDGPFNYTSHLLDVLASHGAKATFFITGNNLGKGQIDIEENGWPDLLRRMHHDGHQIAAHTWTHQNLTLLNATELLNQVHYLEMALRNVLGFFPTYMRPPYSECQADCQTLLKKMGYHVTYQNLVTMDWQNDDPVRIQMSKDKFVQGIQQQTPREMDYIVLNHDTHYQSTWNLSNYMLDYLTFFNFSKSVTVGECMGDPAENWYRKAGGGPDTKLLQFRSTAFRPTSSLYHVVLVGGLVWLLVYMI